MPHRQPLPPEALKFSADFSALELPEIPRTPLPVLGQPRAQNALEFGVAMNRPGYHIFVLGEPGLGRLSMIRQQLDALAQTQPAAHAYAYVNNFDNAHEPLALQLPAGHGQDFAKHIEKLLDDVLAIFPATFENPAYQQKKTALERQFNQAYNHALDLVDNKARAVDIALYRDNETISFSPLRDHKTLDEEQFSQLPLAQREIFHQHVETLQDYLAEALLELPQWRRELADTTKQLDYDTINQAIEPLFGALESQYAAIDDAITYLSALKNQLCSTIAEHLMPGAATQSNSSKRAQLLAQYLPNILVDSTHGTGAPVIHEPHPTLQNLFGRIEYSNDQGTLVTDYRRICAGALHKANGGYLILDAEKMLAHPFVWEGLIRALQTGRIQIESPYPEQSSHTVTLKPEVIPLNVKLILMGDSDVYYFLAELDNEFKEHFKVLADFGQRIPHSPDNIARFALLMRKQAADSGAKPLTRHAIAALFEHSCRLAESQQHFSARINDILEIIGEANLFCKSPQIDRADIAQALTAREYRNGRVSEEILEDILDGTILIDTEGEAIGKINGLTVLEIGGSSFGAPARITTTVYPGSRGIVDIEREAELGQAIHSKGVMILTGYLGHFYAQQFPLAISASIAIEQSYCHIDGDSASLAELCCLISALTRTPIKQAIAITGSINQYGEVQAIGGVNEKIEGFFRLCQARGLTGKQAVIIPAANKRNLMLKQDVLDAVAHGLFSVYCVATANEALELLTGEPAGQPDAEGNYPEHSINFTAISRLKEISEMADDEEKAEES